MLKVETCSQNGGMKRKIHRSNLAGPLCLSLLNNLLATHFETTYPTYLPLTLVFFSLQERSLFGFGTEIL
jgi:hypothetical protein